MINSLAEVRPLRPPARLDAVIDAIGETRFEAELLGFLDHSFGADHLAIFGLDGERPTQLAAISYDGTGTSHERAHLYLENEYWRRDPAMSAVRQQHSGPDRPDLPQAHLQSFIDRQPA